MENILREFDKEKYNLSELMEMEAKSLIESNTNMTNLILCHNAEDNIFAITKTIAGTLPKQVLFEGFEIVTMITIDDFIYSRIEEYGETEFYNYVYQETLDGMFENITILENRVYGNR